MMTGTLAQVSTLLMAVGLPSMPLSIGKGGRWRGSPILPSMERISAVSSPQTKAPAPRDERDVEGEAGAQDVLAQQPELARLAQGDDQVLDGQRVLVADVDDALGGAGGEGADEHALDDAVRVALEDAAVHVGAGVALVGVADQELAAAVGLVGQQLPLQAGGEAGAAAAAQPRGLDLLDDPRRDRLAPAP